ncbi:LAMI_0E10110g1_1 [Lachancea mirantina]|uniref:histone deacetylase n=1 Tax=Lachancea mirantina TaxID=1230905 RepID=A0A1G4JNU7_9SACH|nr:LAMI_0E10110g1_1 [Lachancea mirantina]
MLFLNFSPVEAPRSPFEKMAHFTISSSPFQSQVCDLLPCNDTSKSTLTHALLRAYNLFDHFDEIIERPSCTERDITRYHDESFIKLIMSSAASEANEDEELTGRDGVTSFAREFACSNDENYLSWFENMQEIYAYWNSYANFNNNAHRQPKESHARLNLTTSTRQKDQNASKLETYGLMYDCPIFPDLPLYLKVSTGATLSLASRIFAKSPTKMILINWDGGRHHAFRSKASGFCYVNDIVLLILALRRKGFRRISYIDFDLHHGDAVEKAFEHSDNVQTISLHLYEPGFFPGTGTVESALNHRSVVNIPLLHGLDDTFLLNVVQEVIIPCVRRHNSEILVLQCGADGLKGDKYDEWQLTIKGMTKAIVKVAGSMQNCHVILLGGGGYNPRLMSRFYTYLTMELLKTFKGSQINLDSLVEIDDILPDHEFIDQYRDEYFKFWIYEMDGEKGKKLKNHNEMSYINELMNAYKLI